MPYDSRLFGLRSITDGIAISLLLWSASNLLGASVAYLPMEPTGQTPLVMDPGSTVEKPGPTKVMVVGDSITQGFEGDWTWRYRLWQWFKDQGEEVCHTSTSLTVCPVSQLQTS